MSLTLTEQKMWPETPTKGNSKISNGQLSQENWAGEPKILLEINREKLPSLVASLKKPGYMDLKVFDLGKNPWNKQKQSRLIESFLINIPIPPIVLYKKHYNSFDVIDGRQRIAAIRDFYDNKFELTGLEILSQIEGLTYKELPANIQARLDRHSLSSIAIITKSNSSSEEALLLKQKTLERLNTAEVNLSDQEVRNCLYQGKFNSLLHELANNEIFVEARKFIREKNPQERNIENYYLKKMKDIELILRFFAIRNAEHFSGGMKNFLDIYMRKSLHFSDGDVEALKKIFLETIALAKKLYGENLFKPFEPKSGTWQSKFYKGYYDSLMVGLSRHLSKKNLLIKRKSRVIEETKNIFKGDKAPLLKNDETTNDDVRERINIFDDMLSQVIGE